MGQYRNILLIADSSKSDTPAFERAGRLAKATGADLHVCLFEHDRPIAAVGLISKEVMELAKETYIRGRKEWLEMQANSLRANDIHVTTEVVWGRPVHEKMLAKVLQLSPDLVVKDVRREPLLKRVLFAPLDWQLLRLCPAPLLLVNSAAHQVPKRVIAAVDPVNARSRPEDLNGKIIDAALALAIQCDAQVHLAYVFEGLPAAEAMGPGVIATAPAEVYEELRRSHREAFERMADEHSVPKDRRHFLYGTASTAIADIAGDTESDVVVLGTVHRTGLERLLMGSTAETILDFVPCNVLAVKPEGFAERVAQYLGYKGFAYPKRQKIVA